MAANEIANTADTIAMNTVAKAYFATLVGVTWTLPRTENKSF